jgi:hypothetical protein
MARQPEVLVSLTPCTGYGQLLDEEQKREFDSPERWTMPLDAWDDIAGHARSVALPSIEEFMGRWKQDLHVVRKDPELFTAVAMPATAAGIEAVKSRFFCDEIEFPPGHCPMVFTEPWSPGLSGLPEDFQTMVSMIAPSERSCHQYAFFKYEQLDSDRLLAVRHTARMMTARNELTGESVQCWADAQQFCVCIVPTLDEGIGILGDLAGKNADFLFGKVAKRYASQLGKEFDGSGES